MHHLPFAEASLSHKHRKRVGTAGQPDEREAQDDSTGEDSASAAGEDFVFRQEPPALAYSQDEVHLPFSAAMHHHFIDSC